VRQAINRDDGDRAAKLIQDALSIERWHRQLLLSQNLARRPRAARRHHRRVVADRGAVSSSRWLSAASSSLRHRAIVVIAAMREVVIVALAGFLIGIMAAALLVHFLP
jgi:hypothetical protein